MCRILTQTTIRKAEWKAEHGTYRRFPVGDFRGAGRLASRAKQGNRRDVPAPSGIGDEIVGVEEGADVTVVGSFDSIVDGLIFNARISAPVHAECTRCLKPIKRD